MNPFNEMTLLPKDEYVRLTTQALHGSAPSMQKELEQLNNKYANLPDDQRNKLEQEIITKYTDHCKSSINQTNGATTPTTTSETVDDDSIILQHLNNFRANNKWRAQQLFSHLKTTNRQWNNMGQLLDLETNEPIPKSNIVDLIHYATTTLAMKRSPPAGLRQFTDLIMKTNTPETFLSNVGATRMFEILNNNIEEEEKDEVEENKRPLTRSQIRKEETTGSWYTLS